MTAVITAAIYLVGASVTFAWLKERATPAAAVDIAANTFARLMTTAREAAKFRDLAYVFLCGTCYQAGVATVITLAAIYAQEVMGFTTTDTLVLVLVVNVTACIGALAFGYVQDAIGKKRALGEDFHITGDKGFTWDAIYTPIGRGLGVEPKRADIATDTLVAYQPEWPGPLTGAPSWPPRVAVAT